MLDRAERDLGEDLGIKNPDVEMALIGMCLCDDRLMDRIPPLRAEQFAFADYESYWAAMLAAREAGEPVNPVTIGVRLPHAKPDLVRLAAGVMPTETQVRTYAGIVRDLWYRRALIEVAEKAVNHAHHVGGGEDYSPEHVAADLVSEIEALSKHSGGARIRTFLDLCGEIHDELAAPAVVYPTDLESLNDAMGGGLYAGRSYGIAGRFKAGKSALAGQISAHMNQNNVRHLYVALEMGGKSLVQRAAARDLRIDPLRFLKRDDPNVRDRFGRYMSEARNNTLYANLPGARLDDITRTIHQACLNYGIKGAIVDYLQLVKGQPRGRSTAEWLDTVAQRFAEIAADQDVWMLVVMQMNREGNVRGSDAPLMAFDQVYLLNQTEGDAIYVEMLATRYTQKRDIGSEEDPAWTYNRNGLFFDDRDWLTSEAASGRFI